MADSPLERRIYLALAGLDARVGKEERQFARQQRAILSKFKEQLREISAEIREAQAAGQPVDRAWLARQEKFRLMIDQYQAALDKALDEIAKVHEAGRNAQLGKTLSQVEAIAAEAAREAGLSREAIARIKLGFQGIDWAAITVAVKRATPDSELSLLFRKIGAGAARAIEEEFLYGISSGRSIADTTRVVNRIANAKTYQVRRVIRTETLRTYRDATLLSYIENPEIRGWRWQATLDSTTCVVCWSLHGTRYELGSTSQPNFMNSHPNCRCTLVPDVTQFSELGVKGLDRPEPELGPDLFEKLSDAEKLEVLGPSRYDLYKTGKFPLTAMIRSDVNGNITLESVARLRRARRP